MKLKDHLINLSLLLLVALGWAGVYVMIKLIDEVVEPLTIAAWRATLSTVVLVVFCFVTRRSLRSALEHSWTLVAVAWVGFVVLWVAIPIGERTVSAGVASILSCVVPVTAMVVTALIPGPPSIGRIAWFGSVLACVGLVLAIGPWHLWQDNAATLGILIIAAGFAGFSLGGVILHRRGGSLDPVAAVTITSLYTIPPLWIIAFLVETPGNDAIRNVRVISTLFAIGVVGTALPNLLYFVLVRKAGAVFANLYGYLLPIFGVLLTMIVFGQLPAWTIVLGLPLVFIGVALIQQAEVSGRSRRV